MIVIVRSEQNSVKTDMAPSRVGEAGTMPAAHTLILASYHRIATGIRYELCKALTLHRTAIPCAAMKLSALALVASLAVSAPVHSVTRFPIVTECPVDAPDPQAAAYSASVLFDGDVTCEFFIRRKVQQGETDEQWRARICDIIESAEKAGGYTSGVIMSSEWIVP